MPWVCGIISGMKDLQAAKKRRKVKWAICPWCVKRNMNPPMRYGKRKCLERHMVGCQADFLLESRFEDAERQGISTRVLAQMVLHLQAKVADLSARLVAIEVRKKRINKTWWEGRSPRETWQNRDENARRYIRAVRSCYEPSRFINSPEKYLGMFFDCDVLGVHDLLMLALWPCLTVLDGLPCLEGDGSKDMYHTWKRIWGKSQKSLSFELKRRACP